MVCFVLYDDDVIDLFLAVDHLAANRWLRDLGAGCVSGTVRPVFFQYRTQSSGYQYVAR